MRCDAPLCWDKGTVYVHVWDDPDHQELFPSTYFIGPDGVPRKGRVYGLCNGCYLRLVRMRRRAGMKEPWPRDDKPLEPREFWSAFDGWEPEPENPNDEYMAKMEETVWRGR